MKAVVYIEVPDEWLRQHVDELWEKYAAQPDDVEFFGPKPAPQDYLKERLEAIAEDELRVALFGWPIESTSVDVHGWFPTPEVPEPLPDGLESAYVGTDEMTEQQVEDHGKPPSDFGRG